jgi:hypothetical protein
MAHDGFQGRDMIKGELAFFISKKTPTDAGKHKEIDR